MIVDEGAIDESIAMKQMEECTPIKCNRCNAGWYVVDGSYESSCSACGGKGYILTLKKVK